jgi:plasmid stabilization system protein ParE
MNLLFHSEAFEEMIEAAQYYEDHAPGVGDDFLSEIEEGLERIAGSPRTYSLLFGSVRRYLLQRFPYGIVYKVRKNGVFIIAVPHLRRNPGYWKHRL